uniref:Calcineurin-like phosphoesterase domain-containing protein n=1 Tax=Haptolina ericina TaxID=156174 RepID=A0A7S3ARZ9_9EUKA|mmetsp:Transcript_30281/g.68400  ORF Transcript_30281/g.68400 Transcript_30281/m.68400 type:complete len:413 (+) Transcript_30281:22-1260(+)|eukprot:CAMPEP_0181199930 /NCGR_PEP_ID=MMETSP1096-20121128/17461_1 /TAXON_ID=156174 ORGANISM="Chrysochromulina ericina, Strain CCMP281" /NCGR_SAMPLE_ID=MMETSP1096 /ASSEMBLY_ACC=CAM_ASM_000453 /LENGTH=412 /DNA_ID=CAMNT_0023290189 /DNA_START=1 /DNA_END=1239 /DNA_ORIENTATION=-
MAPGSLGDDGGGPSHHARLVAEVENLFSDAATALFDQEPDDVAQFLADFFVREAAQRRKEKAFTTRVICVSDIHGQRKQLAALWEALTRHMGAELAHTTVVFLGDYCDRGPDTKGVIDWLIELRRTHSAPVHFIAGNHDFGFAAFLGCLPPSPVDLDATKSPKYNTDLDDPKGFWPHPVAGGMHYQGRRWAEGKVYPSVATFRSYGVDFEVEQIVKDGQVEHELFRRLPAAMRPQLLAAVPESHRTFLAQLEWLHEQPVTGWGGGISELICVHAGLDGSKPLAPQLRALRQRDLTDPILYAPPRLGEPVVLDRIEAFSGRTELFPSHPENADTCVQVSGHHGVSMESGNRIILDRSGGKGKLPLEALILPERWVVASDGTMRRLTAEPFGSNERRVRKELEKAALAVHGVTH